ncbi:MAG: VCBS repeat-containing protein [Planctomycetes bacterium]|nr:VCBS repeat-containing protein [Planctomycetota bacterium]
MRRASVHRSATLCSHHVRSVLLWSCLAAAATAQQFLGYPVLPDGFVHGTADVDADGFPDLLAVRNNSFVWHRNDGQVRFGAAATLIANPDIYLASAAADFDGDAIADLAVACAAGTAMAVHIVHRSGGAIAVTPVATIATSPYPAAVVALDLDGDGDRDLVITTQGQPGNNLYALRNDGALSFTDVSSVWFGGLSLSQMSDADAVDVDHDGRPDLLVSAFTLRLLRNQGATFADETATRLPANPALNPAVGDLDGDGDDDLLVTYFFGGVGLHLWRNQNGVYVDDSAASLPPALWTAPGAGFQQLLDADLDGDLDAVLFLAAVPGNYTVALLANDGAGHLLQQTTPDLGGSLPHGVLLPPTDLDGDGDRDVVATGNMTGVPWTLLGDGHGSLRLPLGHLPLAASVSLGVPVDIDGDGDLDLVGPNGVLRFSPGPRWTRVGSFTAEVTSPRQFGDVDGDGDLDVVTGTVALNDGQGNFTVAAGSGYSPPPPVVTALVDVDLDGDLDIVASQGWFPNDTLKLHQNLGNGTFAPGTVLMTFGRNTLDVGDFDGNGWPDIACGESYSYVLMGTGGGAFTTSSLFGLGVFGGRLRALQLGGAGPPDLLVDGFPVLPLRVLRWQAGGFADVTASVLPPNVAPGALAIGDVDGDGDIDLVGRELLRNDGTGALTVEPLPFAAPPGGLLADIDGDRDAELVLARDVLWNGERHLTLPLQARIGAGLRIELSALPGRAQPGDFAVLGLGLQRLVPPLPGPLGQLHLGRLDATIGLALAASTGRAVPVLPVPTVPAIVGVDVHLQALFGPAILALSNSVTTRIE